MKHLVRTRRTAMIVEAVKNSLEVFVVVLACIVLTQLLGILCGCSSFPQSRIKAKTAPAMTTKALDLNPYPMFTDAQCYALLKSRDNWLFTAKLLGGLGGSAAIITPVPTWNDAGRWALGASAAALTVGGVASAWIGESKSDEFEEFCKVEN